MKQTNKKLGLRELETDYLNNVFSKNNYNTDFVRRKTHSNTDSNT